MIYYSNYYRIYYRMSENLQIFENFEKSRVIKKFPLDEFLIFLKILKNWNAIFQMRRLKSSGYC